MPEERLSAVAKRRRLNGDLSSAVISSKDTSRSQSPAKPLTPVRKTVSIETDQVVEADEVPSHNAFSALVTKDVVQFSNFREIERLNTTTVKIRLSKGQKCLVSGRYSLWMKEGLIEFLGAKFEPAPQLYHIHSSTLLEVPSLIAITHTAEFEVYSVSDQTLGWLGFIPFNWVSQYNSEVSTTSYLIHNYSMPTEGSGQFVVKEFDGNSVCEAAHQLVQFRSDAEDTIPTPILLTCGKQFSNAGMLFSWMLNSVLTYTDRKRTRCFPQGIVVLDLDSDVPTFTPPGTVAIVHITEPVLGARFTYPAGFGTVSSPGVPTILKMQLAIPPGDNEDKISQLKSFLEHVGSIRRQRPYSQCPLVVKATTWLENMGLDHAQALAEMIAPHFVVCYGFESSSLSIQLGTCIAMASATCQLINIPTINSRELSSHLQNEVGLQSYFHFRGYHLGRPQWADLPLELDSRSKLWLSYGDESAFVSEIFVSDECIGTRELVDALNGCIVAINLRDVSVFHSPKETISRHFSNHSNVTDSKHDAPVEDQMECLGLGIVAGFDRSQKRICLFSPVPQQLLDDHERDGIKVILIAVKADTGGGFDTNWLHLELGAMVPEKQLLKTVYRRKVNMQQ